MGFRRIGISAAALAGAAALMFTGVASATAVGQPTPTADLQLCGVVSDTGPWSELGTPTGNGVAGVAISGTLNGVPISSPPAITGADGTYCFQGTQAMADAIYGGGYAELTATKAGTTFTTATSSLSPHTWAYNTSATGTQIDLGVFISHLGCSSFMSVCGFNFVAS